MDHVPQEARRIILEVARAVDRKLGVEVREVPGQDRLRLALSHGTHRSDLEVPLATVLAAGEEAVARNELRLRLKRVYDTMLFRPMPDHRMVAVKPVAPPGGLTATRGAPRGRGRR
jgi:hypothetical protein